MRTNKICIYVGKRGTGKTHFVKNLIPYFPQPKTLIVDVLDNPEWHTLETWDHPEWANKIIPVMPVEMIPRHLSGTYRTFSSDIEMLEEYIADYVRNTALIIEDCSRWFNSRLTRQQKNYLLNSKQTNCDVHLFFHTLSSIPPELVKYADYITLFKTGEAVFDKNKFHSPDFAKSFRIVNDSKDRFINRTVRLI